jgi:hypothetical protein
MGIHDGMTGRLFEESFGICPAVCQGYVPWQAAAELVRKHQPRRKSELTRRLEAAVSMAVGGPVVFYTAVHSAMDYLHGTDGFFECCGVVVTIDFTINSHKDCGKADLVVTPDDLEDLTAFAKCVCNCFARKAQRQVH